MKLEVSIWEIVALISPRRQARVRSIAQNVVRKWGGPSIA